jgi:hypothetical protein
MTVKFESSRTFILSLNVHVTFIERSCNFQVTFINFHLTLIYFHLYFPGYPEVDLDE